MTPILHLNINNKGDICLDILKDSWTPVQNIESILISINLLLQFPNSSDPFNSELAQIYRENFDSYEKLVRDFCKHNNNKK